MQLGTRWPVGEAPPPSLPAAVSEAVASVETELADQGIDVADWRWTLTWLERRPVVELDDGTTVLYDPAAARASIRSSSR